MLFLRHHHFHIDKLVVVDYNCCVIQLFGGAMNIRAFRSQLRRLERQAERSLERSTACCGVTLVQCHTLVELDEAGPLNLSELAKRMELDKSTVSRTIDSLVGSSLVKRKEDPDNRRAVILRLTRSGKSQLGKIHGVSDRFYQQILQNVPEDRMDKLTKCLELLADALSKVDTKSCCPTTLTKEEQS